MKSYIPTINISSLIKNNFNTKKANQTIKQIEKACINVGFFQITGHGINLKEIKNELANLSSSATTTSSTIDPAVIERIQSAPSSGASDNAAGLSELKYYIVELMKDQNEIRQIVKELREILEKNEEN